MSSDEGLEVQRYSAEQGLLVPDLDAGTRQPLSRNLQNEDFGVVVGHTHCFICINLSFLPEGAES